MKINISQMTPVPGDIQGNVLKIKEEIKEAKKAGAELVVFPELTITGYLAMDLFNDDRFVKENKEALLEIVKNVKGIAAIIGFVDYDNIKKPDATITKYNSAAFIQDQKIITIIDKTLLPDYDIFYENRYFNTARNKTVIEFKGENIGVMICEDMWDEGYKENVAAEHVAHGASILINISASPFYIGKTKEREAVIKKITTTHKIPFIYINTVGSFDGYDGQIIFDGRSSAYNQYGQKTHQAKAFLEDRITIDCKRLLVKEFEETEDIEDLYQSLVLGIKNYFGQVGTKKSFIGLSGGIDSALVAALAVDALGREHVTGIGMPSRYSSEGSVTDADVLAKNLGIPFIIVPIEDEFKIIQENLTPHFVGMKEDVTEENIQARLRGLILMAFANKYNAMVISTGNKTETALGYCTLYGDMNGGLSAISDVSKTQVYDLCRHINKRAGKELIPVSTIEKPPSAELSDNQTDEESLGADYSVISPLVEDYLENGLGPKDLKKKYPGAPVDDLLRRIHKNEFKRRQAPPGIKVTKKSFGIGRRVPLVHNWK